VKGAGTGSLKPLLDSAADAGFVIDAESRILLWNRAAEEMLGYTAREAVGRRCCDLLVGHDEGGNRRCGGGGHAEDRAYVWGLMWSFEMRTRTKAGAPIWMNVRALRVSGNGSADVTVHLVRDVTASRDLLTQIRERALAPTSAPPAASAGTGVLTPRELETLRVIAAGLNTKDAAEKLQVSPATVRNHVQRILEKLGAHSRLEAVVSASRQRLLY
jgi:PAS domain S-box-containing protein